jgi:D-3-phosphoglycerate dehydrogenase / 2-oxoglutarate reductase
MNKQIPVLERYPIYEQSRQRGKKVMILSMAAGLAERLSEKLEQLGLTAERIDYTKPFLSQISDANVLVNGLGKVDKTLIDSCPKLKLVHQVGTGIDNVDVRYCTLKSIYVANVPHVNNVAVAEHTLFLMIYMAKNMKSAGEALMKRRVLNVLGSELHGKHLTIIGLGATGIEVAKRANCFGMHVSAVTKHPSSKRSSNSGLNFIDQIHGIERLNDLLANSDYVSVHMPLTNETQELIGATELNSMKKSAFLINAARAQIVVREALYNILYSKKIAGAAFDVFWEEPADPNDRLLKLDNFILTPHIAGWTAEAAETTTSLIAANIDRVLNLREKPTTLVNLSS